MQMFKNETRFSWRAVAVGAAMALGAVAMVPAWAAEPTIPAGASNVETHVDTGVQTMNGIEYRNGGVGASNEAAMKKDAGQWPLRMMFSATEHNEFVAGVKLNVRDSHGKEMLKLDNAGPMTFVRLQPGKYMIVATHNGIKEERTVEVGHGTDLNFHWKA